MTLKSSTSFAFLYLGILMVNTNETINKKDSITNSLLTAKTYSKIFAIQRGQHNQLVKQMLQNSYEKNYKLLDVAYSKIFKIIQQGNETINAQSYMPLNDGFPHDNEEVQKALTSTLENCCLSAETILHFPEITYRIFEKLQYKWKETLNWCIELAFALQHIIDEPTIKLMDLLAQEINIEVRREDYVNPYYEKDLKSVENKSKQKKQTKKLKKGPQLNSGGHNEL